MSDPHSTPAAATGKPVKPSKPYPDFPLTAHPVGQWCKKIRGKLYYFGPWGDPDGALDNYLKQKDELHAGRKSRPDPGTLSVKDVANAFLNAVQSALKKLAKAYKPQQLAHDAYSSYECFRPDIPAGKKGLGAKGNFDLGLIDRLAKEKP